MNLKEQLYVCTLAEVGNMSKAAEKLYISQPALSLYINNLQKRLGMQLFVRKNNVYSLTYIGEKYVEKSKKMLRLESEFEMELSNFVEGVTGRLKIGVQSIRAPHIIPDISRCFRENYPNIELIFNESNIQEIENLLSNNMLDLVIYTTIERKEEFDYIHIFDDPILLAVNSNSKLRRKAKWIDNGLFQYIDIRELQNEIFILPQRNQSLRQICEALFRKENFKPKKIIELRSIETIMKLVSSDFGIGFNRLSYAKNMAYINGINYLNIKQDEFKSELVIAYRKECEEIPNFEKMMSSIKKIINIDE
ncbi:MAG: LysR family transcriptional regulator [Tissierellia bacterium]|nr:LysR family transcriptional regulator [Tissierellia bacterium]